MAIDATDVSLGAQIWGYANNQPGVSPPPSSDINYQVFAENPFWGPQYAGPGAYNGWGQYGVTLGDDRIYGLSVKSSNYTFQEYTGKTYNYDNNYSGGFVASADIYNNTAAPSPPNFYDNNMNVACQLFDSTFTNLYAGQSSLVGPGLSTLNLNLSSPSSPMLAILYWRVLIYTGGCDPASTTNIDINGTNYVTSATLNPNSTMIFDFQTYGTANFGSTGQGYDGAYFYVSIN
jgi:hypothetical protein